MRLRLPGPVPHRETAGLVGVHPAERRGEAAERHQTLEQLTKKQGQFGGSPPQSAAVPEGV